MPRIGSTSGAVASTSYAAVAVAQLAQGRCSVRAQTLLLTQTTRLYGRRSRQLAVQVQSALLDPPPFNPSKLNVRYLPGVADSITVLEQRERRYTLTHNDLTGDLTLSIGLEYNREQLDGWYTRILRDEVLAEWRIPPPGSARSLALHVYCHVSGEEGWPAPPTLRSFIFQREMTLVLDTIAYAERALLLAHPAAAAASVYVHLRSDLAALNRVVEWGQLGDKSTWQQAEGGGVLKTLLAGLFLPSTPTAPESRETEQQPEEPTEPIASTRPTLGGGSSNGSTRSSSASRCNGSRSGSSSDVHSFRGALLAAPGGEPPWPANSGSEGTLAGLAPVEAALPELQPRAKR